MLCIEKAPLHIDVHQGTIAWMMPGDLLKIYVTDVSGGIVDYSAWYNQVTNPIELVHSFFDEDTFRRNILYSLISL